MIYINGRFLTQKPTGVHRFSFEMCKALHTLGLDFVVLSPPHVLDFYHCNFPIKIIGKTSSHLWEQIELPLFLKSKKSPLLISFMGLGCVFYSNQISTIHDVSFLRNPQWFSKAYYYFYKIMTPWMARKSKKIITVSNFSKHELIELLQINENKLCVIYNAVAKHFFEKSEILPINEPYILAVSSLDPRKNFSNLIHAFLKLQDLPHKLYIIGGNSSVFSTMNLPISDKIVFLNYVSNHDLVAYYKQASLFVYPSLYEGFGIPPLEAMSQQCPVLVSDIQVLHEVCKDAVFYCNPNDSNDIANQIHYILTNPSEVEIKKNIGLQHINNFSWKASASKLLEVIKELDKE